MALEQLNEHDEALQRLLDVAHTLHKNGVLDFIEQTAHLTPELLSYLTDPRILKIGANISFLLHLLEMIEPTMITVMVDNFSEALSKNLTPEVFKDPPRVGLSGILRMLGDPDVQRALGFLFLLLKSFGQSIQKSGKELTTLMEQMEKQFAMMREQRKAMGLET